MEELIKIVQATIVDTALAAKLVEALKAPKFTIRTEAEETQFKSNLIALEKDNIIKEEKKNWMKRVEDDVREVTGLKQNPSEPYHEFMKRGFKALQDKVKEIEAEKVTLEQSKDGSSVWKQKYETLEQQSKQALQAKDDLYKQLEGKVAVTERRSKLDEVLNPLKQKFINTLPGYFKDYEQSVINDVLTHSAIIDGKLVLVDENGNPRKDTNLNNILVESHLAERFKEVIKVEHKKPGAGTNPPTGGKVGNEEPYDINNVPSTINTQAGVTEFLGKAGLLQGTKEFDEAFTKVVSEKNITKVF